MPQKNILLSCLRGSWPKINLPQKYDTPIHKYKTLNGRKSFILLFSLVYIGHA